MRDDGEMRLVVWAVGGFVVLLGAAVLFGFAAMVAVAL